MAFAELIGPIPRLQLPRTCMPVTLRDLKLFTRCIARRTEAGVAACIKNRDLHAKEARIEAKPSRSRFRNQNGTTGGKA